MIDSVILVSCYWSIQCFYRTRSSLRKGSGSLVLLAGSDTLALCAPERALRSVVHAGVGKFGHATVINHPRGLPCLQLQNTVHAESGEVQDTQH